MRAGVLQKYSVLREILYRARMSLVNKMPSFIILYSRQKNALAMEGKWGITWQCIRTQ
nr:MAG TPA_asm: hypothetical protein [Caudoviricetes sp.]